MKSSQKGFIVPLIIIILALVIGGGVYYVNTKSALNSSSDIKGLGGIKLTQADANKITEDVNRCSQIPDTQKRDLCFQYAAYEDQDPSLCLRVDEQYPKDECYNGFAGLTKDVSFCNKIETGSMKAKCLSALKNIGKPGYRITSTGWANPQVCDPDQIDKQNQDTKDICYKEFAREYKDVSLCSKIISPHEIRSCYQQTSISAGDYKICSMDTDLSAQRLCLEFYAQAKGDANACAYMKGSAYTEYPNWSKDQCYRAVAGKNKDSAICSKIITPELKANCLNESRKQ